MQVQLIDGRNIELDVPATITPDQGLALAAAAADMLVRSGRIRDDVPLSGPQILQFLSELGDELSERRDEKLVSALDAVHYYIDASDREISDAGTTREDALLHARELRDEIDPPVIREMRAAS